MRITRWKHVNVAEDGTPENGRGKVETKPQFTWSHEAMPTPSTMADHPFLVISPGREDDGSVQGVTIYFEDQEEVEQFVAGGTVAH